MQVLLIDSSRSRFARSASAHVRIRGPRKRLCLTVWRKHADWEVRGHASQDETTAIGSHRPGDAENLGSKVLKHVGRSLVPLDSLLTSALSSALVAKLQDERLLDRPTMLIWLVDEMKRADLAQLPFVLRFQKMFQTDFALWTKATVGLVEVCLRQLQTVSPACMPS